MNCRVVVEAAVPVYDVETPDEAVRIAISKTGEMLNPDLNYVEINMGSRSCPHCGEDLEPAFIAADESLVALELEMTVFNVERDEHAARIARKEIGQRLENIPLEVLEIEEIEDDEKEDASEDESSDEAASEEEEEEEPFDEATSDTDETSTAESAGDESQAEADQAESEPADEDAGAADQEIEEAVVEAEDTEEALGQEEGGNRRAAERPESGDEEILPEFEELIDEEQ